jgi:hypothetical protein
MPGERCQPAQTGPAFVLLLFTFLAPFVRAQELDPSLASPRIPDLKIGGINVSGNLRLRAEGWNWFLDDTRKLYAFGESRLQVSFAQNRRRFSWQLDLEQPTLWGLPDDAFLPSTGEPLGLGGIYFRANGDRRNPGGLFITQAFVQLHGLAGNSDWLRVGRFRFSDGAEGQAQDPTLNWLRRERIANRLLGDSDWPAAGRSLDGISFHMDVGQRNDLTLTVGRPTPGVYQTGNWSKSDEWSDLDVDVVYGAFTRELTSGKTASEFRAFGIGYHDGRRVLKVDNRALAAREADMHDIRIGTFGFDYLLSTPFPKIGQITILTWGAIQSGNWGVLDHFATAMTGEIGWQPTKKWWRPWLRAGALATSADGDPNDTRHRTFFQMLPTERQYARIPFYTMQNIEDYTGQVILQPSPKLQLRSEIHKVKLHGKNDLWYQGSGAFQNTSFGYDGRAAKAAGGLANFIDLSGKFAINPHMDLGLYFGALSGKSTMTSRLNGRKGGFTFGEFAYKF